MNFYAAPETTSTGNVNFLGSVSRVSNLPGSANVGAIYKVLSEDAFYLKTSSGWDKLSQADLSFNWNTTHW